jgi:hypothetical protein
VKIKGLLISLILVIGVLLIPSFTFASAPPYLPSPPQPYDTYGFYAVYENQNTNTYSLFYYQDITYVRAYSVGSFYSVKCTQNTNVYVFAYNEDTGLWNAGYQQVASLSGGFTDTANIYESNFPILDINGNYVHNSFNVSSPVQDTIYTTKPNISFDSTGYTTTISAYLNEGQASFSWDVTPLTSQPIVLLGADLPLVHGVNKLVFMNGSTELKTITFTYQPSVIQNYYINGVIDGQTYDRPPTVEIGKDSNTPELQFIFNGQTILLLPMLETIVPMTSSIEENIVPMPVTR